MIDPIAIGETKEYVSKLDKGEDPTVWFVGTIDSLTKAKIMAGFLNVTTVDGKQSVVKNQDGFIYSDFTIVEYGLKGFKNFGKIEFETEKKKSFGQEIEIVKRDVLLQIPLEIIRELSDVIWGENQVSEELEKN